MDTEFRFLSRNFIFAFVSNFLYFGSFYLLLPTMPQFVANLGGTPGQIGLVMGFFTLAAVAVRPSFGMVADRLGRKQLMLIGAGFFALLFSAYMQIQSVMLLYCIRILHGLAHAGFLAASTAYVADLAPPSRRGEVIGMYGTSNVFAMAVFPAVGTEIIYRTENFTYLLIVSMIVAGIAFMLVFGVRELVDLQSNKRGAVSLTQIATRRGVLIPSLALMAGATAYGAVLTFLPVFAPQRGLPDFGVFFTVFAAFTLLSRVVAGKLSDKVGRYQVIMPFMLLVAAAVFGLASLDSYWFLSLIGACFGLGFGAFMPTLNALVVDKTPLPERGRALAFFTSFMDLGITTGSVLLGIIGELFGYEAMFYTAGAIMLLGLLVFAIYMRPKPEPSSPEQ